MTRKILCEFHDYGDEVEASGKCEKCGALVCVEHTFKNRIRHVDEADNVYELCPECYHVAYEQKQTMKKIVPFIFVGIFVIFGVIAAAMIIGYNNFVDNMPEFP